jgi:hypothetical protein
MIADKQAKPHREASSDPRGRKRILGLGWILDSHSEIRQPVLGSVLGQSALTTAPPQVSNFEQCLPRPEAYCFFAALSPRALKEKQILGPP